MYGWIIFQEVISQQVTSFLQMMSICRHFTSDFGPDLEPIMTPAGLQREAFERAYRMGALLGKGGFGTVYAGERTKDGLPVAIKVIKKAKITQWCQVTLNLFSLLLRCVRSYVNLLFYSVIDATEVDPLQ